MRALWLATAVVALAACADGSNSLTATGFVVLSETMERGFVATPRVGTIGTGSDCTGVGDFADIAPGATVTVRDASGKIVGINSLGRAPYDEGHVVVQNVATSGTIYCQLPFTVKDVAGGSKFHTVEVAHRGRVTISEKDLGRIRLTVGP